MVRLGAGEARLRDGDVFGASSSGVSPSGVSTAALAVMLPAAWLPIAATLFTRTHLFSERGHQLPVALATDMVTFISFVWAMCLAVPAGLLLQRWRPVPWPVGLGCGIVVSAVSFYSLLWGFSLAAGSTIRKLSIADPFRAPIGWLIAPAIVAGIAGLALLLFARRGKA